MQLEPTLSTFASTQPDPTADINQLALHAALTIMRHAGQLAQWCGRKLSHGEVIDPDKVLHLCASLHARTEYLAISTANGFLNDHLPDAHLQIALSAVPPTMRQLSLQHLDPALTSITLGMLGEAGRVVEALLRQYESGHLNQSDVTDALANIAHYQAQIADLGSA